jgi:hypothetical protein
LCEGGESCAVRETLAEIQALLAGISK